MNTFWHFPPTWMKTAHPTNKAILFYDGACAFCSAIVRFVIIRDTHGLLTFALLQEETIKMNHINVADPDSILFYSENGETLYKSDASIALYERLGDIWFITAKISKFMPKILTDFLYNLIAKIRYRIAVKLDYKPCPLLPKNYQSKILLSIHR